MEPLTVWDKECLTGLERTREKEEQGKQDEVITEQA